jgi:hypothetical protein
MASATDRTCAQLVHQSAVVLRSIRTEQTQRPPLAQLISVLVWRFVYTAGAKTRISSASIRCGRTTLHKAAGPTDAARALLRFLTAPEPAAIIRKTGMEPG